MAFYAQMLFSFTRQKASVSVRTPRLFNAVEGKQLIEKCTFIIELLVALDITKNLTSAYSSHNNQTPSLLHLFLN